MLTRLSPPCDELALQRRLLACSPVVPSDRAALPTAWSLGFVQSAACFLRGEPHARSGVLWPEEFETAAESGFLGGGVMACASESHSSGFPAPCGSDLVGQRG